MLRQSSISHCRLFFQLVTDVHAVEAAVATCGGPDRVCAVVSSTSCFAPRGCDAVVEIAQLCARLHCGHVINNAYGVQVPTVLHCHDRCIACASYSPFIPPSPPFRVASSVRRVVQRNIIGVEKRTRRCGGAKYG